MKSKINLKRLILLFLVIITVNFIWSQSKMDSAASAKESITVTETIVQPVKQAVTGNEEKANNSIVRKYAHAIEFGVLGIELLLFNMAGKKLSITGKGKIGARKCFNNSVAAFLLSVDFGVIVACVDEVIQAFNDRCSTIKDVWIDGKGLLIGVLLGIITVLTIKLIDNKRIKNG